LKDEGRVIVGVPKESYPGERRVALVPVVIPNLVKAGLEVIVEAGAGEQAGYPDAVYVEKGAKIVPDRAAVFSAADIVVQVLCYGSNDITGKADLPLMRRGQAIIGFLRPLGSADIVQQIAQAGVTSFSVELMPRTTRAQSMDALLHGDLLWLQSGLAGRRNLAANFSYDDDRRRHHHARPRVRHRRGRGRTASDLNGSPPGRRGLGL